MNLVPQDEEEVKAHSWAKTSTGESVSASEPIYIAKYITSEMEREKIVVATESEVMQSG